MVFRHFGPDERFFGFESSISHGRPQMNPVPDKDSPETERRPAPAPSGKEEHQGATEDQVQPTPAPAGPEFDDEPKEGG